MSRANSGMESSFRHPPQKPFNFSGELVIDSFAGGGGASTGMEAALGRSVDIAINHDPDAIRMHEVNHPHTWHITQSVYDVDPVMVCRGRPVGAAWFSPDCKHHSKARGGTPVDKNIRGLAWAVVHWALAVRPRELYLENVEEFKYWGPLMDCGNGLKKADPKKRSETFCAFVDILTTGCSPKSDGFKECLETLRISADSSAAKKLMNGLGYHVEHRELRACDYGVPTSRKRLFIMARCDHLPIKWPEPTHGEGLLPYKTAADIIDWSLPCPSIFERKKPLAENTLKRIARGIQKFVIDCPDPFIVRIGQTGFGGDGMQYRCADPLTTVTSKAEHCLVIPHIERQFGRSRGNSIKEPLGTVTAGGAGKSALVATFLAKHYTGVTGQPMGRPLGTVTTIDHHSLITSHLCKLRGTCKDGQPIKKPLPTITAGGNHLAEVRAFLIKYYSTGSNHPSLTDPLATISTRDRFGLVIVKGEAYQIVDIGLRMLQPHELFAAHGFPADYVIAHDKSGKKFTKAKQVQMVGNSVPPKMAEVLMRANYRQPMTALADERWEEKQFWLNQANSP